MSLSNETIFEQTDTLFFRNIKKKMSGTDELDHAKNGIGAANESIPSTPSATSDLNGHSESKGSSTGSALAVDRSAPIVTSTASTSPSNWVQFGNGDDNSDNVSSS